MLERMKIFVWFCGIAGKSVLEMLFEMYSLYRTESMKDRMLSRMPLDVISDEDDGESEEKNVNVKYCEEYLSAYV